MATQRPTPLVCITRAGLTVAVAVGLTAVFADQAWLLAALIAAIAPHALLAWTDRRWPPWVGAAVVLAGAVVFTIYVVEPHTTAHGLLTNESFRQYFDDLRDAPRTLRSAVVPVVPVGSALLLALVALWLAGGISEWCARQFDATLGAIGPSLVLFVTIAALGEGGWVWPTVTYCIAAALYLVALHQAEWTERRSWFHGAESSRSRVLQGGVIGALGVVFAAAVVAPLLPGSRSDAWFDYRSLGEGDGGSVLDAKTPILFIQPKLQVNPDHEVFTVEIGDEDPAYWRVAALDVYDGQYWTFRSEGEPARALRREMRDRPPDVVELEQTFNIIDADPYWLPAAYYPVEVNLENASVVLDSATMYLKPDSRLENIRYEVTSEIPETTEAQRLASPPVTDDAFARYRRLPGGFPDSVSNLAHSITDDEDTPWEKADAIERYLNSEGGYTYSTEVTRSHSLETIEDFLFDVKVGYCEQFAAAFAAMARSVDLPTRIAVGYTYGTKEDGRYHVKNADAHAWPEVYFSGLGWLAFEPTPGRGTNAAGGTGDPNERPPANEEDTEGTATTAPTTPSDPTTPPSGSIPFGEDEVTASGEVAAADDTSPVRQFFMALAIIIAIVAILAVVALVVLVVIAARRSWQRRHADDARDRVLGAWAEALDHLAEAGVEPKPSATPMEFALRHAPAHGAGDAGPALMELAHLQTAALFAPGAPSTADADAAWGNVDAISHAVAHQVSTIVRWRRRLDPRRLRDGALAEPVA